MVWYVRASTFLGLPANDAVRTCLEHNHPPRTTCCYLPAPSGNFLYTLQTGLELLAFYRLRTALPGLHRPYRVPGGRVGTALALGLPCITLMGVITTVNAPAAGVGVAIALGTVIAAQVMFQRREGPDGHSFVRYAEVSAVEVDCRRGTWGAARAREREIPSRPTEEEGEEDCMASTHGGSDERVESESHTSNNDRAACEENG